MSVPCHVIVINTPIQVCHAVHVNHMKVRTGLTVYLRHSLESYLVTLFSLMKNCLSTARVSQQVVSVIANIGGCTCNESVGWAGGFNFYELLQIVHTCT